jgi:hypothetical protein
MKSGEIIRVIICTIIGLGLAFWVQPLIFQNKIIYLKDVSANLSVWLPSSYTPSAMIVVVGSLLATIIWCFMTAKAQVKGAIDISWLEFGLVAFGVVTPAQFRVGSLQY